MIMIGCKRITREFSNETLTICGVERNKRNSFLNEISSIVIIKIIAESLLQAIISFFIHNDIWAENLCYASCMALTSLVVWRVYLCNESKMILQISNKWMFVRKSIPFPFRLRVVEKCGKENKPKTRRKWKLLLHSIHFCVIFNGTWNVNLFTFDLT